MAYLSGVSLALAVGVMAALVGFDRSRVFYPVLLIAIASYYCLFAVMGQSDTALWGDGAVMLVFVGVAIAGFRTSLWLVVVALAAHGALDLVHHRLIANPGVPGWWPGFCATFDVAAAAFLALRIRLCGTPPVAST